MSCIDKYFALHFPAAAYRVMKFGYCYSQTDDLESDIDVILCTYAEVDKNKKVTKILDNDNDSFFGTFFSFLQA